MELYWILRLPALKQFCEALSGIILMINVIAFIIWLINVDDPHDQPNKLAGKILFFSAPLFIFVCITCCMIPSRQDLAIMLGWDAIRSQKVSEVVHLLQDHLMDKAKK